MWSRGRGGVRGGAVGRGGGVVSAWRERMVGHESAVTPSGFQYGKKKRKKKTT